jgi:predicted transcriptional regulator
VKHRVKDRKLLYRPLVREGDVARNMSAHFIEGLFEGSLADMVSHLLNTRKVSPEELNRLAKLIAEKKKEQKAQS